MQVDDDNDRPAAKRARVPAPSHFVPYTGRAQTTELNRLSAWKEKSLGVTRDFLPLRPSEVMAVVRASAAAMQLD